MPPRHCRSSQSPCCTARHRPKASGCVDRESVGESVTSTGWLLREGGKQHLEKECASTSWSNVGRWHDNRFRGMIRLAALSSWLISAYGNRGKLLEAARCVIFILSLRYCSPNETLEWRTAIRARERVRACLTAATLSWNSELPPFTESLPPTAL